MRSEVLVEGENQMMVSAGGLVAQVPSKSSQLESFIYILTVILLDILYNHTFVS